ncbi:LysR family transcriptional regulator [Robertmurraya massiliosenegalensis]|uniref:LysR family transcriptional regulator n=1 Tax=Robertmurraya massiliosenegalensis TaxID=1287657 RepID=UPI0002F77159|nr:LysR family transcriptional regulator [Robertmurraya massiliosenegalensis]
MDHHLVTFVTVAEKKNFTRAAEALHITQSAVTLTIKGLEKEYGVKFFDRTNKYVRLTKAGEVLYHQAKEIINKYKQTKRLIDDLSNSVEGQLFIGSSFTFGEYLLPRIVSEFKESYPLITPDISIRNSKRIITRLLRHELDVGIVEGAISHPNLVIQPFAQDEMLVITSLKHPFAYKNEVYLEDLNSEKWILREDGSGTRQTIDRLFSSKNFSPNEIMSFGSSQIIKESVEAGLGISIMSKYAIQKEVTLGTLHPLRIKDNPIVRDFSYVIHQSKFHTRIMDTFLEFLNTYPFSNFSKAFDS